MKSITGIRSLFLQYILGLCFALLVILVTELALALQPGAGFGFLVVTFLSTAALQILFYCITGTLPPTWKMVSYLITLTAWLLEQHFITSVFYQQVFRSGYSTYTLMLLSAMLWVTNKIVVDALLALVRKIS